MKILAILLLLSQALFAQEAIQNFGQMQLHENGSAGFHANLVNNGNFDQNKGLIGFYSTMLPLSISGNFRPTFYDFEVMVENNLYLDIGVNVENNINFIVGDVITPKLNNFDIDLQFNGDAFYSGDTEVSKVNGYAVAIEEQFVFPLGSESALRPLAYQASKPDPFVRAAYFNENPNYPISFNSGFNTDNRADNIIAISSNEFWHYESTEAGQITLNWGNESKIVDLANEIDEILVVGWNIIDNIWENLGGLEIKGDLNSGFVTSNTVMPDTYAYFTFGTATTLETLNNENILEFDNYYLSPNGDGINDYLVLDGIEKSKSNEVNIYNRWGSLVYKETNYANGFNGKANQKVVFNNESNLPDGTYFYIIKLFDLGQEHQGYLYLIK
jgi:gliding motility-associated-like protein